MFGPQHPAAHGVLCCIIYLKGEYINFVEVVLGYLHRGTEKLCEYKTIEQALPYFDRLDYVSVVCNEHLLALNFELLLRCSLSLRISALRILMCEFTRCFNGLLCVSCMAMDIGSLSPMLWSFEERDKIMLFFDITCGCRMHLAYMCFLGVLEDLQYGCVDFLLLLCISCLFVIELYDLFFFSNRVFYLRLRGIGFFDFYDITFNSISGVVVRTIGICFDIRLICCYEIYFLLSFDFCFTYNGDAFDRILIRVFEMKMSILICKQILHKTFLGINNICFFDYLYVDMNIESIIGLFYSIWSCLLPGISFCSIEHPKGDYSIFLCFVYGSICRLRIRCSDFLHVFLIDFLCKSYMLHDIVAIIGNLDIVFGSVDR